MRELEELDIKAIQKSNAHIGKGGIEFPKLNLHEHKHHHYEEEEEE